jgi:hypothetical protein
MQRILICGHTISLAGLAASLNQWPGCQPAWEVIYADLLDLGAALGPEDVVIVEAAQVGEALARLRPCLAWRLFGVDTATGTLTAYVAQSYLVQGMAEIGDACRRLRLPPIQCIAYPDAIAAPQFRASK